MNIRLAVACCLLSGLAAIGAGDPGDRPVLTFAGGGDGDGATAMEARFHDLKALAVASEGVLYVVDGHRVRRIEPGGPVETVVGASGAGFSGNGGPAVDATLLGPEDLEIGPDGCLYIADTHNHRIRRVDGSGVISTVAGNGRETRDGNGSPAAQAALNKPHGICFGPKGSLYIADTWNNCVRRVDPAGIMTTVAGSGVQGFGGDGGPATEARLNDPRAVAVASDGTLFVVDRGNQRVRKVAPSGTINTFAGNGEHAYAGDGDPAATASLFNPIDVAVGPDGAVYIVDGNNHRIRRVDGAGVITTFAGNGEGGYTGDGGPAAAAAVGDPERIVVMNDGRLFIVDRADQRIRVVGTDGVIRTIAGKGGRGPCGDGGPARNAGLRVPQAVTVGSDGVVYIADTGNHRVARIGADGIITSFLGSGRPERPCEYDTWYVQEDCANTPYGLAVGSDGFVYVALSADNRIVRVNPSGGVETVAGTEDAGDSGDRGSAVAARLNRPNDVFAASDGTIYIADTLNHRVRRVTEEGVIDTVAGDGWRDAWDLGRFEGDGGPAAEASLNRPAAVAAGPAGRLYIADTWNHRVRRVDVHGLIRTIAGTGERGFSGDGGLAAAARLSFPNGLALDADGSLLVCDAGNARIRRIDADGRIETVAGGADLERGAGDGASASGASLLMPRDVAVGPDGTIYITDTGRHRIRMIPPAAGGGAP